MQEQQGATTHFLYQLYISLEKKKKAGISAAVMEISQPAAAACLHKKENEIYADVRVCVFMCLCLCMRVEGRKNFLLDWRILRKV